MRLLKIPFGIIVNFFPKFAEIERYFYDVESQEILTSDGKPFEDRLLGAGELARVLETSCLSCFHSKKSGAERNADAP